MAKTYDADSGTPVTNNDTAGTGTSNVQPMPANGAMASIINIPPQIAVTLVWVALGFVIAWYFMRGPGQKSS